MHLGIYLASEPERTVFVDNGSDDDLYYAVYRRVPVDNTYYLYRVREPLIIEGRRAIRVQLAQDKEREYVVLAKQKAEELPDQMYQDESGDAKDVMSDPGIRQKAPEVTLDDTDRFDTGDLSKKDLSKLDKVKAKIDKQREELGKISKDIDDIKDPGAEVEQMEQKAKGADKDTESAPVEAAA